MRMSLNPVSRHRSSQFQESSLRPFYFTVVFWGAEHRAYFTDLLVASLLSPNNIPALKKERRSKFLIVTTLQDWRALQDHVLFRRLCLYVEPIFFEMPFPQKGDLKMLVMSKGHKQVSMKAYEDQAYGVYVTPDLVLSDGSVSAMERLAEEGKKVVLCVAIRFQQETILPELEQKGFLAPGCPLSMSSRELMDVALKHLHSETLRYEFEAPYFADSPISVYWWTVPGQRMIIHSFSWAPLVVDYGALKHHDTQTFENWTLDGDYIHRNFPNPGDVYVVTDSDEISLVSFTKEADLHFDLVPEPKKAQYGILTHVYKVGLIRALKDSLIMDPLKRYIFPKGVLLHSDASDPHKSEEGKHVEQVIRDACRPPTMWEQFFLEVIDQASTSRFAYQILQELQTAPLTSFPQNHLRKYFWIWVLIIRPRRVLLKILQAIAEVFRPLTNQVSQALWFYRYRRFLWWRLKEKLGVVEQRGFDWRQGGWDKPAVSLVCPLFTLMEVWRNRLWFWRYRRFVWWRLKEKLHIVEEQHFRWDQGGWEGPGISLACPIHTLRWGMKNRVWLWENRHLFKPWVKNFYGYRWKKKSKNPREFNNEIQTRKIG